MYLSLCMELFTEDSLSQFLSDFIEIKTACILSCYNDNVVPLGKEGHVKPEKFPYQPLDHVPFNRVTCLFADRNSQPCLTQPVLFKNDSKVFCVKALTGPI